MRNSKARWVVAILALAGLGAVWVARNHDSFFTDEGLLTADAGELKRSGVTPVLESPIAEGESVLWCGTFQLAWNEACSLLGEDLDFEDESPLVEVLNEKSFTKGDLDAASYVAVAGFVKDDVHGQIERALQDTFHGRATPRFIPSRALTPRPEDIVAYSYLFKNLEFAEPFEKIATPLTFGEELVPCFGIGEEFKQKHWEMLSQCLVFDYQSKDDFIVELETKGEDDQLVLAKVPPGATLAATIDAVLARMAATEPVGGLSGDVLKVPKLNFDITRTYDELQGGRLVVANPQVPSDATIVSAVQNIRFQLDEEGVRLKSESHISIGCSKQGPPRPQHIMIFDKPFLILLKRRDADVPYFALWVDNAELLVKAEED